MGKQGPCYHCGITTTPLWRNGPPDKPVLCNACGSRWRTKGTLLNYMPMHSGGFGTGDLTSDRWGRALKNKPSTRKRKEPCDRTSETGGFSKTGTYFSTSLDEDVSTRSSLGSEMSTFDGPTSKIIRHSSNFPGIYPVRGKPWETPVPSRKRTTMFRSRASSEKITKSIISLEEQEVSSVTYPSSEAFLIDSRSQLVAVEIGLGSVFVRQPAPMAQEPESEASSLLIDSKGYEQEDSRCVGQLTVVNKPTSKGKEKAKQVKRSDAFRTERHWSPNKALLEKFPYKKRDVLHSSQSPLVYLEMKDMVNFDTFTGLLTDQEQSQLTKLLSSVDVSEFPESLRSMFSSVQFESALANFQELLADGMFDSSNHRVLNHYQELLELKDLTESGWMERCSQLQTRNKRRAEVTPVARDEPDGTVSSIPIADAEIQHASTENQQSNLDKQPTPTLQKIEYQSSDMICEPSSKEESSSPVAKPESASSSYNAEVMRNKSNRLMEEGHDSGGEPDLLLDVPSRASFQQAELLERSTWSKGCLLEEAGEIENGGLIISNTWHMDNTADWDGLIWNPIEAGTGGRMFANGTILNPR